MRADFLSGSTISNKPLKKSGHFSDELDDMQRRAARFALDVKTCGMFAEQGTGKTWITLAVVEQLLTENFAGLLVVMKNNKETTWQEQCKSLCGCEVTGDWERFKKIKGPRLLLIHYEQLIPMISKLARFGNRWTFIGIDECQRLMSRGSKSSRAAARLRHFGEYRLGLSGTPLEQQPQDVWAQMRFINSSVFGDKWKSFDRRFLVRTGYEGYKRKFREERRGKFMKLLKPWCIRITKDFLGLKPMKHKIHTLPMLQDQESCYRQMKTRNVISLRTMGGGYIRAPLTITRNIRLSQIAGGFLQTEKGYYWIGNAKLRKVRRILKKAPHPVVVFCRFIPELLELERDLSFGGYKVLTYSGATKDKASVQRSFQAGEADVLICQERAGGVGLDLFKARTLILYSCSWSSIAFDQLLSRIHRRGQEHAVTAHHLLMKKTIDIRQHKRIKSKIQQTKTTTDQLKKDNVMGEYAIAELADELGISGKEVRQQLRKLEIPKTDGRYAWKNEKEFKRILAKLSGKEKAPKAEKGEKAPKAEKKSAKAVKNGDVKGKKNDEKAPGKKIKNKDAGPAPENKKKKKKKDR